MRLTYVVTALPNKLKFLRQTCVYSNPQLQLIARSVTNAKVSHGSQQCKGSSRYFGCMADAIPDGQS